MMEVVNELVNLALYFAVGYCGADVIINWRR
jgi:hypothetical protein